MNYKCTELFQSIFVLQDSWKILDLTFLYCLELKDFQRIFFVILVFLLYFYTYGIPKSTFFYMKLYAMQASFLSSILDLIEVELYFFGTAETALFYSGLFNRLGMIFIVLNSRDTYISLDVLFI